MTTILAIVGVAIISVGSVLGFYTAIASAAPSQSTVYNNIPNPVPGNTPSIGFEATSTSEYGSQVELAGTQRKDAKVTVLLSSWACKSGTWHQKNCITNQGSTFNHPVTLNVYEVGDDEAVGALIKSETKSFAIPYRPTADDGTNCKDANGAPTGAWWDGTSCFNGKSFKIDFKLTGVTLPDNVIIGVAYNTSHHGNAPIGETACNATQQGCPYDALNVGTNPTPTVGQNLPTVDDAYYDTSFAGFYCDGGTGGTGAFRLDSGCWTGYLPAISVEASSGKVNRPKDKDDCKNNGWKQYTNPKFNNQGECIKYVERHKHDGHNHHHGDKDKHKKHNGRHGFYNLWYR